MKMISWFKVLITGSAAAVILSGCGGKAEEPAPEPVVEETATDYKEALPEELEEEENVILPSELTGNPAEEDLAAKDVELSENVYGWLYVPGTNIDAGITTEDHRDEFPSCCVFDRLNYEDFGDPNTILHFDADSEENVVAYGDAQYFEEHPHIYIYTDDAIVEYTVFASYETAAEDLMMQYDFLDLTEFQQFIFDVFHQRNMTLIAKDELEEEAGARWQMITLEKDLGNGQMFLVLATLSGIYDYS